MRRTKSFAGMSDPAKNPMFRRNWTEPPHCEGFRSIGEAAAKIVANVRLQRRIINLCKQPRLVTELLAQLGAEPSSCGRPSSPMP